jgi:hypothetical protein
VGVDRRGVAVVIALVAALFLISDDDESGDVAPSTEAGTTTEPVDTTAAGETSVPETTASATTEVPDTVAPATSEPGTSEPGTSAVPPLPEATRTAVWPWVDTDTRYEDPVEAATGFATDFLGFEGPLAGEFMAGDNRSGEVELRAFDGGPPTVVFVRQLTADDSWWILGAASENITIDEPETWDEVVSPLTVSGTASAFEGTVDVELRADGNGEPILNGFVTGSGGPEPGPYSETFEFTSPGETGGALVMLSRSSEDGSVIEASAIRIFYR